MSERYTFYDPTGTSCEKCNSKAPGSELNPRHWISSLGVSSAFNIIRGASNIICGYFNIRGALGIIRGSFNIIRGASSIICGNCNIIRCGLNSLRGVTCCALNIIRGGANIISGALAPLCGSEPVCLDSGLRGGMFLDHEFTCLPYEILLYSSRISRERNVNLFIFTNF